MIDIFIKLVDIISQGLILLVILSVILSYFMTPYHPVRRIIDQIIEPILGPIRKVVPLVGMIDISPLILIILIQIISFALNRFLATLR